MGKTVSQIAREYGISEQGLYKRIKKLSTELSLWLSKGENGVTMVSPEGERILTRGLTRTNNAGTTIDEEVKNRSQQGKINRQPIEGVFNGTVDALISILQGELNLKNKQIEDLTAANKDLTSALLAAQQTAAHAQALHAGTMRTQLLADGEVKDGTPRQVDKNITHQFETDVTETPKVGFLRRIFGRK